MRVLVAGAQGQVARSLIAVGATSDCEVIALGRPDLDLTMPDSLAPALAHYAPDIVVNAAAYTAVDKAEHDAECAFAINATGAGHLAAACNDAGIAIIHLSTDYVFDGAKATPYVETDPVAPLGVYGHSKLAGERLVASAAAHHLILRTAWVVSPYGNNFIKTMLRLAQSRPEIGVVADQIGCPTYAPHLADAILAVARHVVADPASATWGIYHASGSGEATWYDLACELFRLSQLAGGPAPVVRALTTAEYPTPARRPVNSRLECSKLKRAFGLALPDWRIGIEHCMLALATATAPARPSA